MERLINPEIFSINRLQAHSDHLFYPNKESAEKDEQIFRYDLNGTWLFSYGKNLQSRIKDFYKVDYDSKGWDTIQVPGHLQLQGYDKPHYVNTMYPWDGHNNITPPMIPTDYNPVGSYVKFFTIPPIWKQDDIRICFEGVESAFSIWLNGEFVGYSEDSFTPSNFDLTPYIQEGENKLAVEVYKWCSGSWLEDQDFWRFSGIFRDVYLYTTPSVHIEDLFVKTYLSNNNQTAELSLELNVKNSQQEKAIVAIELLDSENMFITSKVEELVNGQRIVFAIQEPVLWSAEKPYLYQLYLTLRNKETDEVIEVIKQRVGIRCFKLKNNIMHLNGKRIVFKGVNRHEFSCDRGRAITKEEMLWDIKFLKQHNFNAVRTSHYPNHPYWYQLCDEYGIYLIDEVNLESHGTWQKGHGIESGNVVPDDKKEWLENIIDRAKSMFERDKNHPSILMWSCGNESYGGENIYKMSQYFREKDDTRLVHYEGVFHDRRFNDTSDMESQMYTKVADVCKYLENNPSKPFILCEYAHAMGNSNGALHKYIELENKYPMYQGGFIWDYIDQGIRTKDKYGKDYIAFGGDFDDRPTDYNFCVNGIVYADRRPSPKMQEVKYLYQDYKLIVRDKSVIVKNESLFTNTEVYQLVWQLKQLGRVIKQGKMNVSVEPGQQQEINLPINSANIQGEYTIDVALILQADTLWAAQGHEVAYGQKVCKSEEKEAVDVIESYPLEVHDCDINIGVKGRDFKVIFSRSKGGIVSLKYGNQEFIDSVPKPHFWRATTDNDRGNGMSRLHSQWKIASLYAHHTQVELQQRNQEAVVIFTYDLNTMPKAEVKVTYTVKGTGCIGVELDYEGKANLPAMPVFGMSFKIPSEFDELVWYGNGKQETYTDRKHGARLDVYSEKVIEGVSHYVIPQECGNKTDVRWAKIINQQGVGIKVVADESFEMSAIPYTAHELENAYHHYELPPIYHTVINVNQKQIGVGGDDSWGASVHPEYQLPMQKSMYFKFNIDRA